MCSNAFPGFNGPGNIDWIAAIKKPSILPAPSKPPFLLHSFRPSGIQMSHKNCPPGIQVNNALLVILNKSTKNFFISTCFNVASWQKHKLLLLMYYLLQKRHSLIVVSNRISLITLHLRPFNLRHGQCIHFQSSGRNLFDILAKSFHSIK